MAENSSALPLPYQGNRCTKRSHVLDHVLAADDERLHACDCGCAMIGNGYVEIRFGLLPGRFPNV